MSSALALMAMGLAVAHQQAAFRIDAEPVELVETNRVGRTLSAAEKRLRVSEPLAEDLRRSSRLVSPTRNRFARPASGHSEF